MKRNALQYLDDVLESIELVETYTRQFTEKKFLASQQVQDSVLRRIEIIGEAVKNIPLDIRDAYPHIPWQKIAGMRDIVIHEYFRVDLTLTWTVVKKELPRLKRELQHIRQDIARMEKDTK